MPRRDDRESGSKRDYSIHYRDLSPKRKRRDEKVTSERKESNLGRDGRNHTGNDGKHHRSLETATYDYKIENVASGSEINLKTNGQRESIRLNPSEVPRSRSYFQHDERGSAGNAGHSFGQRAPAERGWWRDVNDHNRERIHRLGVDGETQSKRDRSRISPTANATWSHDKFLLAETELPPPPPPPRKRPAFREKVSQADENVGKAQKDNYDFLNTGQQRETSHFVRPAERVSAARNLNRSERDPPDFRFGSTRMGASRDRIAFDGRDNKVFPPRERNGGGGYGFRGAKPVLRIEKWKHDLFDEANRSPTPKKEEEQMEKLEALLAS